jgi:hypothetical protein
MKVWSYASVCNELVIVAHKYNVWVVSPWHELHISGLRSVWEKVTPDPHIRFVSILITAKLRDLSAS